MLTPGRDMGKLCRVWNGISSVRLFILLTLSIGIAGCTALLETDQARLCRMALPAIAAPDAKIEILKQSEFPDGRGLRVDYRPISREKRRSLTSSNAASSRPAVPRKSTDLMSIETDSGPLSGHQLATLIRYWLATPEGRAADPAPLGDLTLLPSVPRLLAYGLQQGVKTITKLGRMKAQPPAHAPQKPPRSGVDRERRLHRSEGLGWPKIPSQGHQASNKFS